MSEDIFKILRLIPRSTDFLDRRVGSKGELFYDRGNNSLRIFNGSDSGGVEIAKTDLSNVPNQTFASKAAAAGIGGGGGNTTVTVGPAAPSSPTNGNLWFDTTVEVLFVYDSGTETWKPSSGDYQDIQNKPSFANVATSGDYTDLTNRPNFSNVATSGDYNDLINQPTDLSDLTDNTNLIPTDLTDLGVTDGTPGQFLQTDGSGNFSFQDVSADIGSFVFTGTNIQTDDSSAITVTPSVVFSSDVTAENEIFAKDIILTGIISSQGSGAPEIRSDSEIYLIPATTTVLSGLTTLNTTTEIVNLKTGATGIVNHDLSAGTLFFHSSPAANFTANFVEVPNTNNRTISVAMLIDQGATARIPNAVQIEGSSQTIRWAGGTPPSGTANYIDLVSFILVRVSNSWIVIGSLSTFN